MTITSRQLRDEDDYQAVRNLTQQIYALDGPLNYCTVSDLDWWRYTDDDPDAIQRARIWVRDDGAVVGFAWPSGDRLEHFSLPDYRDIEPDMIHWAEQQMRESAACASMTAYACDSHDWRKDQLRALGLERTSETTRYWYRPLDDLPPATPIGDYVMRHVRGPHDVPERVAAHRDAFAPSKMTEAKHRAVMASLTYRPELDLVFEAPDGTIAAYCIVWLDDANQNGVFEPVGCRSAHRRRGLTKALMYEGMRRLRTLGASSACVASHPTEAAANGLYASVGFTSLDVIAAWTKPLS